MLISILFFFPFCIDTNKERVGENCTEVAQTGISNLPGRLSIALRSRRPSSQQVKPHPLTFSPEPKKIPLRPNSCIPPQFQSSHESHCLHPQGPFTFAELPSKHKSSQTSGRGKTMKLWPALKNKKYINHKEGGGIFTSFLAHLFLSCKETSLAKSLWAG